MTCKFANCPWPVCSDSKRCSGEGFCVARAQAKALGRPLHCGTIGGCPKIAACVEAGKCALDPASYGKVSEAATAQVAEAVSKGLWPAIEDADSTMPLMGHAEIEAEAERRRNFGTVVASTPPIYSGIVGDADVPLNEDTDARRWAKEFMQAKEFIESRGDKLDEGTMLSWFSNAIMCGIDSAKRRYARMIQSAEVDISSVRKNAATLNDVAANAINRVHDLEKARKWLFLFGVVSGASWKMLAWIIDAWL